ncbi:MAG: sigma-70 family RNA polymerase sigma factor [Chitinivibrionales bacterium]|nr:sigma-70 family RNA polymerase sigma factor [Chitinivibrionales bacterium]
MREQEFNTVYAEYSGQLYNYTLWMTGNKAASEDILQTVFLRVWRCDSVPSADGARKAWLFAVCRNACYDYFRASGRSARFRLRYAKEHTSYADGGAEDGLVWRQLSKLKEKDRSIVYLHVKLGWPYADIAELLKTTENNVRVRAFRAFRRLRELFTEKP